MDSTLFSVKILATSYFFNKKNNITIYFEYGNIDIKKVYDHSSYTYYATPFGDIQNFISLGDSINLAIVSKSKNYRNVNDELFYITTSSKGKYYKKHTLHIRTPENNNPNLPNIFIPDDLSQIWQNIVKKKIKQQIHRVDNFLFVPLRTFSVSAIDVTDIFANIDFVIFYGNTSDVFFMDMDIEKVFSYGVKDIVYAIFSNHDDYCIRFISSDSDMNI